MALPRKSDLVGLDFDSGGLPAIYVAAPSGSSLGSLDGESGGLPLAGPESAPSTAEGRITHVVVERLSQTLTTAYITQVAIERLMQSAPPPVPGTSWNRFDEVNTFDVTLIRGTLTSAATDLEVLNGTNRALLGDEIIGIKTVTSLGGNSYRLSYLLRGRLGTEWAMNTHSQGERFVMLTPRAVKKLVESTNDIGTTRLYRGVNTGQSLQSVLPDIEFHDGIALKPYAPCHIVGTRDGGNNLTLTWVRRTRIGGEWRDGVDVPLGEQTEAYEVDILDSTGAVVRTITATSQTASYSSADQTTDFGGPQALITVVVYQMSEAVGRGYGAQTNV